MTVLGQSLDCLDNGTAAWVGTIEDALTWAFQVEKAGRGGVAQRIGPAGYRSAWGGIAQWAALGVAVDCAGSAVQAGEGGHDAAAWIAERVAALPGDVAALVVDHARAGTRPVLCEAMPVMVAVMDQRGKPAVVYSDVARRKPSYCPVRLHPLPEARAFARATWVMWWDAMALLAIQVGADMVAVEREPWAGIGGGEKSY